MWKNRNDDGTVRVLSSILVCSTVACLLRSGREFFKSLQVYNGIEHSGGSRGKKKKK